MNAIRSNAPADDIAALRPIRAVLGTADFWALQEHRRRCEDLGGKPFLRLAQLIRAKTVDAYVDDDDDLPSDIVTGTSRVTFALNRGRAETRTLYHWGYPDRVRHRLAVGTFLGVTLLGMSAGTSATLLDGRGVTGVLRVLTVQARRTCTACD